GDRLFLGDVEGEFRLPGVIPAKLLMITAGCGITPVLSMLRELERRGALTDVVHVHAARTREDFIFGELLTDLARREPGYDLQAHFTATDRRPHRQDLDLLVPDWRDRTTFLCGPDAMMSDFERHWNEYGDPQLLHREQYRPTVGFGGDGAVGESGTVAFRVSGLEVDCEPGMSILVAGEQAGAQLPHGCRMGICHSCIGRLQSGQVRDLRTGQVHGEAGQAVRTCVNGPCGDIEIEL
ncbi:MAG: iron-sulfur cluster-binding domain-containing protein, partial [Solirubrobacteraceae bacterium]|nr:iron-sulfur cluster-binding domain-containing protein [Solirubrobacteraceae bacterium]